MSLTKILDDKIPVHKLVNSSLILNLFFITCFIVSGLTIKYPHSFRVTHVSLKGEHNISLYTAKENLLKISAKDQITSIPNSQSDDILTVNKITIGKDEVEIRCYSEKSLPANLNFHGEFNVTNKTKHSLYQSLFLEKYLQP